VCAAVERVDLGGQRRAREREGARVCGIGWEVVGEGGTGRRCLAWKATGGGLREAAEHVRNAALVAVAVFHL
jgi:hypothetical protein